MPASATRGSGGGARSACSAQYGQCSKACGDAGESDVPLLSDATFAAEQILSQGRPLAAENAPVAVGTKVASRIANRAIQLETVRRPRRVDMRRF